MYAQCASLYEECSARSRYQGQGKVITSRQYMWDVITCPCPWYLFLIHPKPRPWGRGMRCLLWLHEQIYVCPSLHEHGVVIDRVITDLTVEEMFGIQIKENGWLTEAIAETDMIRYLVRRLSLILWEIWNGGDSPWLNWNQLSDIKNGLSTTTVLTSL